MQRYAMRDECDRKLLNEYYGPVNENLSKRVELHEWQTRRLVC